jgi:uncharacterized protein (DUF433 family)
MVSITPGFLHHAQERSTMTRVIVVIVKDVNIFVGEPVFRGTRVPFKILIDDLEGGDTLDQFLEEYPSVSRELAIEEAKTSLVSQLQMRVLVDECAPRAHKQFLTSRDTNVLPFRKTVQEARRSGKRASGGGRT